MTESEGLKSSKKPIGRNNLSWAEVVYLLTGDKHRNGTNTKKEATPQNPTKLIESQETNLGAVKSSCVDSLDDRLDLVHSQRSCDSKLLSLSSIATMEHLATRSHEKNPRNQAVVANNKANRNPNLNLDWRKGERGSSNNRPTWCDHCKKARHTLENCWFLHPELRSVKGKRRKWGGGHGDRKEEISDLVEGFRSRSLAEEIEPKKKEGSMSMSSTEAIGSTRNKIVEAQISKEQRQNNLLDQLSKFLAQLIMLLQKKEGPFKLLNFSPEIQHAKSNNETGGNFDKFNISPNQIGIRDQNVTNYSYKCTNLGLKMVNFTKKYNNDRWILDSGATDHMTGNKGLLENYQPINNG